MSWVVRTTRLKAIAKKRGAGQTSRSSLTKNERSRDFSINTAFSVQRRLAFGGRNFIVICLALIFPGPEFRGRGGAVEERSYLQRSAGNEYEKERQASPRNCRSTIHRDPR